MRTSIVNSQYDAVAFAFDDWHYPRMNTNAYNPDAWRLAIRKYMKDRGLSGNAWAKAAGVSEGTLRNFLKGQSNTISVETLEKLAAAIDLTHSEILSSLFETNTDANEVDPIVHVPVLSWVQAGRLSEVVDIPRDIGDTEDWVAVVSRSRTLFAVEIRGTSINRVAPPGSVAVGDYSETDLISGKMYAITNGGGEGTVKRYRENPARFEPDSTEPHPTIFLGSEEIHVIGRIIQTTTRI